MLYYVKHGDSLYTIARKFNVTIEDILKANIICNPNLIFPGEVLIIPGKNLELPRAGGYPYYIVMPKDSLYCIAVAFNTTVDALVEANKIKNPNQIYPGAELLISFNRFNGEELYNSWKETGDKYCEEMSSLMLHGIFYIGTFRWEALGSEGVPYLVKLLNHPCAEVRYFTVLSLGRIAKGEGIASYVNHMVSDSHKSVSNIASLALKRIGLVEDIGKRVHVTIGKNNLLLNPKYDSPSIILPEGTPIKVLRWRIPSPTGEEGPRGDIQIYDYVEVLSTGQVGFLPRIVYNDLAII